MQSTVRIQGVTPAPRVRRRLLGAATAGTADHPSRVPMESRGPPAHPIHGARPFPAGLGRSSYRNQRVDFVHAHLLAALDRLKGADALTA